MSIFLLENLSKDFLSLYLNKLYVTFFCLQDGLKGQSESYLLSKTAEESGGDAVDSEVYTR